jgi:hypothetical protein
MTSSRPPRALVKKFIPPPFPTVFIKVGPESVLNSKEKPNIIEAS